LKDFLARRDIQALVHYPVPVHLQPAYRQRVKVGGQLTRTERLAQEILSLPLYPGLTEVERMYVIKVIRDFSAATADV
jgi:dTDP-4-amino-4,6-dideoxygalactose transaminase